MAIGVVVSSALRSASERVMSGDTRVAPDCWSAASSAVAVGHAGRGDLVHEDEVANGRFGSQSDDAVLRPCESE